MAFSPISLNRNLGNCLIFELFSLSIFLSSIKSAPSTIGLPEGPNFSLELKFLSPLIIFTEAGNFYLSVFSFLLGLWLLSKHLSCTSGSVGVATKSPALPVLTLSRSFSFSFTISNSAAIFFFLFSILCRLLELVSTGPVILQLQTKAERYQPNNFNTTCFEQQIK